MLSSGRSASWDKGRSVLRIAHDRHGPVEVFESVVNATMVVFTNRFPAPE